MAEGQGTGILTRTIIRSPVIRWLLHARIRHRSLNDAVFVGEDFVHVRQILPGGHLEHITTKDDFDARIRAASVINIEDESPEEDFLVKLENGVDSGGPTVPRDLLVLTLSTNDLVFLYLTADSTGHYRFVQQAIQLPPFDRILFQPGEHLAVEPESRALAVAANEGEVVIYSMKGRGQIREQIGQCSPDWCPVVAERALHVEGVIQCTEFLIPPDDDTSHVILLLIVVHENKMKAICIEWHAEQPDNPEQIPRDNSNFLGAHQHPALPISTAKTVPSLLIPLRNASFLVITRSQATWYTDILSGSLTVALNMTLDGQPHHPGNSASLPLWTNWCRPARTPTARRERDDIYLVREDGLVSLLEATSQDTLSVTAAGNVDCHVGTAFASLGRDADPDVLAAAGEMCSGCVVKIGHWPTNGSSKVSDLDWLDTMTMDPVEIITNWASATDMCVSSLPQSHGRSLRTNDAIFVTSGRQPYGSVTELRHGLEARLSLMIPLGDLSAVTGIWIIPLAGQDSYIILLAFPSGTSCLVLAQDGRSIGDGETDALLTDRQTLAAAITTYGSIAQITSDCVCETSGLKANFEDAIKRSYDSNHTILVATIDEHNDRVLLAKKCDGEYQLTHLALPLSAAPLLEEPCISIQSVPLAITCTSRGTASIVVASTAEHGILAYTVKDHPVGHGYLVAPSTSLQEVSNLCDSIAILRSLHSDSLLVLCGLRGGRVLSILFTISTDDGLDVLGQHEFEAGSSAARFMALAEDTRQAYMCVGSSTCLVTWDGPHASDLSIDHIWLSDKDQPELAQSDVLACVQIPTSDHLEDTTLGGSMIMVTDDQLLIGQVSPQPRAVPRQLHVQGTPNRLVYSESHRSLVVASMKTEVTTIAAANGRAEPRRKIWPVLDFISARADLSSFSYDMQPGERVYSLTEWSYKEVEDGKEKLYAFIIVAGSYVKSDGSQGGRVLFLQPSQTNKVVTSVREEKATRRFDAPVYALALYDEVTYVVCYGQHVALYRFEPESRKWSAVCAPLLLHHSGIHVTVEAPLIYISSLQDSLITLRFEPDHEDEQDQVKPRMVMVGASPRADASLSHLVVKGNAWRNVGLLTTKNGSIVGLDCRAPSNMIPNGQIVNPIMYEASMPWSLTRIKEANIRPPWKPSAPNGVLKDNIIGITSNGTLVGVSLLDDKLWRRLSWLQRLCEWSPLLSPHSHHDPTYNVQDTRYARHERALPMGLAEPAADRSELVLRTSVESPVDRHIDGDILNRLLEHGGEGVLKQMIIDTAERGDTVGIWMRGHLTQELEAVPEMIRTLRTLLSSWL